MIDVLSISSAVASDRANPEDVVLVVRERGATGFVIADGAGGLGGGARAAQLVVEGFESAASSLFNSPASQAWCDFLLHSDRLLERDSDAGESTAIVAAVRSDTVWGASVGDSEAWLLTERGECIVLTSSQDKARLGSGRAHPISFKASLREGVLLAATDGLFRTTPAERIRSTLSRSPTIGALLELARSRSGRLYDDVGAVLLTLG